MSVREEQISVCAAVSKTPDRNNQEGGGLCGSEFRNIPVCHDGVDKGEFTVSGAGGRGSLCLEI